VKARTVKKVPYSFNGIRILASLSCKVSSKLASVMQDADAPAVHLFWSSAREYVFGGHFKERKQPIKNP